MRNAAVLTDLWPSRSEPTSGRFVQAQVVSVAGDVRSVVLVPRLVARAFHRRIWGDGVNGWQEGYEPLPPPGRLLEYRMARIPRVGESAVRARAAERALRRAGETPDLVHGHFLLNTVPAAIRLGRAFRVPVVATVHGSDVRMLAGGIQPRLVAEMERALRAADRILAVAPGMTETLVAHGADPDRVVVLPMGIDEDRFSPRPEGLARERLALDPSEQIVLFVGRRSEEKGLHVLGRAVRDLGVRCYAAGPGEIHDEGVEPLGVLSPDDLATWLAAADVVCLPSYAEGMPVSIAEALASGTPVVATRVGGIPEQVRPGVNGFLVEPGDASALATALRRALAEPWDAAQIRASSEPFWGSRIGPRLAALYDELIG